MDGATGTQGLETDTGLTYNPSSGVLTSTQFTGALSGNATTATTATNANHVSVADNENTDENNLITFIENASATGNVGLESDGDFHYNPSTGLVSATGFSGNLTGTLQTASQTNITAVGTIATGTWQGTAIADSYISSQSTWNAKIDTAGTGLGKSSTTLNVDAAQTGITSLLATDIKIGEDDQTKIDFETADEIHFYANNVEQVYLADNIFGPQSDSDVDLGTTGVRWKDAYVDTVTTTGAIAAGGDIELGHASDTTLARVSAGVASIEGKKILTDSNTTAGVLLLKTTISDGDATVDFNSTYITDTYNTYDLYVQDLKLDTDGASAVPWVRFGTGDAADTDSDYSWITKWFSTASGDSRDVSENYDNEATLMYISPWHADFYWGGGTGEKANLHLRLHKLRSTTAYKGFELISANYMTTSGSMTVNAYGMGFYHNHYDTAVNFVQLGCSNSDFESGTVSLYGYSI